MERQAEAPPDIRAVAIFLRNPSKSSLKTHVGIVHGKRVDYFKGKSALKAVQSPAYAKLKNVPPVTNAEDAQKVLSNVLSYAFYLRAEKAQDGGKQLNISQQQLFSPEERYVWFYEGSQWTTYAGAAVMVLVMLAGVMFPLWPDIMRQGVWYLSIAALGFIGLFIIIAIIRLIFYIITILTAPPGIWIFPKLFADVGFVDSFIPLYEWDLPKKKSKKKRVDGTDRKGKQKVANGQPAADAPTATVADAGPTSARIEEIPDEDS